MVQGAAIAEILCRRGRAMGHGLAGLSAATLLLLAIGCTSHTTTPLRTAADLAKVESGSAGASDAPFQYARSPVPFDNHNVGQGASPEYSLRDLTIPSIGDNAQADGLITARYFRSELPGPRPLVIILPIFARHTYPSEKMCQYIQRHSRGEIHVLDVQGENFLLRLGAGDHEEPDEATVFQPVPRGCGT